MTDRLVWVDRSGKELATAGDPSRYGNPHLSADGRRLAFDVVDARTGKDDIWIRDLNRNVSSRFSFSKGNAGVPTFSPDGSRIVYAVDDDLVERTADGQGAETSAPKGDGFVRDRLVGGRQSIVIRRVTARAPASTSGSCPPSETGSPISAADALQRL
jgi:dipeptidyl aminopeptidase/acylaminoacyl peptidase